MTAHDIITEYCNLCYTKEVQKYACAIGSLYLFSDTYYSYDAMDLALTAIYYATKHLGIEYKHKDLLYPPGDSRPRPCVQKIEKINGPIAWIDGILGEGSAEILFKLLADPETHRALLLGEKPRAAFQALVDPGISRVLPLGDEAQHLAS